MFKARPWPRRFPVRGRVGTAHRRGLFVWPPIARASVLPALAGISPDFGPIRGARYVGRLRAGTPRKLPRIDRRRADLPNGETWEVFGELLAGFLITYFCYCGY